MLKDRIALITGASRGMGRATCLAMARYGANIVAADIDLAGAEKTAKDVRDLGRKSIAVKLDVSKAVEVDAGFAKAMAEFGRLDIMCNYAGIVIASTFTEITEDQWEKSMAINAKGALLVSQAAARIMKEQKYGRIINTASQSGTQGEFANGPYCISKATIKMMTQIMAIELSPYNILVTAMSTG
ncbi:MAG: SDR family oxidoreductase, partial [Planctomycetaceae bacterium]|nr:SDR family oxidoreductase [Planctomycetaceae bacterium]